MFIILVFTGLGIFCTRRTVQDEEPILAQIGDRNITVKEFRMRTEMTIRPKYPALENDEIKRICLNNLIAEKLLAIEGQKEKSLIDNPVFKAQMKGIREQAMREELYKKTALETVQIDTHEMKKICPLAGREYKVSFYSIHDDSLAKEVNEALKDNPQEFEHVYRELSSNKRIPQKTVTFKDPDPVVVHGALFSEPLNPGKVIGPLKIEDNNHIVLRVDDWTYYPAVSSTDVQRRWHEVEKKLTEEKAYYRWGEYVGGIMKGKKIDFEKETFINISKIFFEIYRAKDKAFKQRAMVDFLGAEGKEIKFNNQVFQDIMLDHPFFSIDDEVWTVRDFKEAYMSHPLVFKYQSANLSGFQYEFRMAIINMIRDVFLTKEAYNKGLEKHPEVKRTAAMWEDSYVALYHKDQYLKALMTREDFDKNRMKEKDNYFSLYVDSLQDKYSEKIKINFKVLQDIELVDIDLFVMKPGVPYPVAVPSFPEYLQDGEFDYGNHMQKE